AASRLDAARLSGVTSPPPAVPPLLGGGCPRGRSIGSTGRMTRRRALVDKRGATVEGVNLGGFLLGFLGVIVFGFTSIVALGLLIARKTTVARIVFAAGLLLA